ncbi:MAG: hypothetical protein HY951_18580 [Bacteroidia bacterium]|nr:hypothetical protein [Bacteroidia bacterium]
MQTQNLHIYKSLNFSRWSRKAYASFISIGKVVKISTLKAEVAQGFIKKSKSFTEIELFYNFAKEDENNEHEYIVSTLIPITLTTQQSQLNNYQSSKSNILIIKIFSLFISVSICLRFFYFTKLKINL